MKKLLLILLALLPALFTARAEGGPGPVLENKYAETGACFKAGTAWYPYPAYSDRQGWAKLLGTEYSRMLIANGEKYLGYQWKHIPASIYVALAETGNKSLRNSYNNPNRAAFVGLAMAELAEGKGRFLPDLADGFWYYATAGHWSITGETGGKVLPSLEKEDLALGSVRVGSMVCTFWPFFKDELDRMDPMINKTFKEAVHRIILDPYIDPELHRWWEGGPTVHRRLNNHTPWCCHNILHAFFVVEEEDARIDMAVRRALKSVDQFLNDIPSDGLCEEGPTYWFQSVGRLQEFLLLLKDASGGRFDILPNDFITKMGVFISRCCAGQTPSGKEIVANYGDAHPFANYKPFILWQCGNWYDSNELLDLARYASWNGKQFKKPKLESGEGYRALENARIARDLFSNIDDLNSKVQDGMKVEYLLEDLRRWVPKQDWYPVGQQAFIHTSDGWFFSCKGAHNSESHNHNDVGSCILYIDGIAVLADSGTGVYTSKTFGPHRYEIWTMQSEWHNVPLINGTAEANGSRYRAKDVAFTPSKKGCIFTADISGAYPKNSDCRKWIRSYKVSEGKGGSVLEITDSFELGSRKAPDVEHFLLQGEVILEKPGIVILSNKGRRFEISYPSDILTASVDIQEDLDSDLRRSWGKTLTRLNLTSSTTAPLDGTYTIRVRAL